MLGFSSSEYKNNSKVIIIENKPEQKKGITNYDEPFLPLEEKPGESPRGGGRNIPLIGDSHADCL